MALTKEQARELFEAPPAQSISSGFLYLGGSVPGRLVPVEKFTPFDATRIPGDMTVPDPRASKENHPAMELAPVKMERAVAIQSGFTGDECSHCGSMRMVNTGTCQTCQDCSTTTGCS